MAEEPATATVVTVGKDVPYPTGTPPDGTLIPGRVHTKQELTDGPIGHADSPWEQQKIANLAAGGMIVNGDPWTPPPPPEPDPEA